MAKKIHLRDVLLNLLLTGTLLGLWAYGSRIHQSLEVTKSPILVLDIFSVILVFFTLLRQLLSGSSTDESTGAVVPKLLFGLGLVVASVPLYHILGILYGAPLIEQAAETFHLALLMAAATSVPCVCVLSANFDSWIRVLVQQCPETGQEVSVMYSTVGSLLGTWLGAFPLPLDWDRPWQAWPISCALGTVLGHMVGLILATAHLLHQQRSASKLKLG